MEDFWVTRFGIVGREIFDEALQCSKHVVVEVSVVLFALDVGLKELENISPEDFHRTDHVILCTLLNGIADVTTVQLINLDEVVEDQLQVAQVARPDGVGDTCVCLDHVAEVPQSFGKHENLLVHARFLKNHLPFVMHIVHQFLHKVRKLLRHLSGHHMTKALIDHEPLLRLQVSEVFRQHVDQVVHVRLDVRCLVTLSEHVLRQLSNLEESL